MKNEMMSAFIAKEVIALQDGEKLGYILSGVFSDDLRQLKGFVVVDEENEQENFLPIKNIKMITKDVVFIDDTYNLQLDFIDAPNYPIGKKVYDGKGVYLGQVKECELENLRPTKLITSMCELPVTRINFCGKSCIFFGKSGRAKTQMKIVKQITLPKVEILEQPQDGSEGYGSAYKIEKRKKDFTLPTKIILSPPTLLNKTATADVYGFNNELIVKEGQVITQSKIDKAKIHGKIGMLLINSK